MKTQYIALSFLLILGSLFTTNAQHNAVKKENVKVWGECGMCKKKIETAAKDAGAATANWNENTKMLSISYNSRTNTTKIQEAIAAAGYDTKDIAATGDAYNKLPECCHYDRKETQKTATAGCCADENACNKNMSCCKDGKCDKTTGTCKDISACKEKGCCKS
jgi:mercuric ion binding protein